MQKSVLHDYWVFEALCFHSASFPVIVLGTWKHKYMHFNCTIQSPGHSHSWYTTSWSHLCTPQPPPPPVHMAQMWSVCATLRLDVCCQSASRPSIYCKSCSVFKAKEINTWSASQNHSNTSAALANKGHWHNANEQLSSSVFSSRPATLSGVQANPSP